MDIAVNQLEVNLANENQPNAVINQAPNLVIENPQPQIAIEHIQPNMAINHFQADAAIVNMPPDVIEPHYELITPPINMGKYCEYFFLIDPRPCTNNFFFF